MKTKNTHVFFKKKYILKIFIEILVCVIFSIIVGLIQRYNNFNKYYIAKEYLVNKDYDNAINNLEKLNGFKDSEELEKLANKGKVYLNANKLFSNKKYEQAIDKYQEIIDFEDSEEKLKEAKYLYAIECYNNNEYDKANKFFLELDDYNDSKKYVTLIANKNLQYIYNDGCNLIIKGEYRSAIELFEQIYDYKDSKDKINECKYEMRLGLRHIMAAGVNNSYAIKEDNTVIGVGDNDRGQLNFDDKWNDIISIDAYGDLVIGLKSDGHVVVNGSYDDDNKKVDIEKWEDIIDIAAGQQFVVGLKYDGTILASGYNTDKWDYNEWDDIIDIDTGWDYIVGLTKEHELLFTKNGEWQKHNYDPQKWKDVISISSCGGGNNKLQRGRGHTVGLKSDGTVIAIGDDNQKFKQCSGVLNWKNVKKICAGDWYTVGVTDSGGVLITGENIPKTQYIDIDKEVLSSYTNIIDVCAGFGQTMCLKKDGSLIVFGFNDGDKRDGARNWNNILIP